MSSPSSPPLPPGERKKTKEFGVPPPLMGEGQDEDENAYLNPSLRGTEEHGNLCHPVCHSEESGDFDRTT